MKMITLFAAAAALAGASLAVSAPASAQAAAKKPMTYDCTKAGNKNKAACKTAAPAMAAAPAPAAKPMAAAPMAAAPMAAKPAAKAAMTGPNRPGTVTATLKNGKVVHYDCTLAGNKSKKACKA